VDFIGDDTNTRIKVALTSDGRFPEHGVTVEELSSSATKLSFLPAGRGPTSQCVPETLHKVEEVFRSAIPVESGDTFGRGTSGFRAGFYARPNEFCQARPRAFRSRRVGG